MNVLSSRKENSSKIYIVGAGNFAREIYSYLAENNFEYNDAQLVGFLADKNNDKNSLDNFDFPHKIVGDLKCLTLNSDDFLIVAITNPALKEQVFEFYDQNNGSIISYIHPTAIIGHDVSVGVGTVFAPYSMATTNVTLGRGCTINAFSSIGHDAVLGDFCTLSGHCDVTGNVKLGDKVFMGSHASIIPSVQVGAGAVIGAGSLVIRKVKENTTVFGNPAKKIM